MWTRPWFWSSTLVRVNKLCWCHLRWFKINRCYLKLNKYERLIESCVMNWELASEDKRWRGGGAYLAAFTGDHPVVDPRGFISTDLTGNDFNLSCRQTERTKCQNHMHPNIRRQLQQVQHNSWFCFSQTDRQQNLSTDDKFSTRNLLFVQAEKYISTIQHTL